MSENSTDAPVLTERRDDLLIITLNRPEVRNAVNKAVSDGVAAALDELDGDDSLAVAVMTGAGTGSAPGMDLKAFAAGQSPGTRPRIRGHRPAPAAKPIIAAVEGFAVAGGLEVALACDLLVASRGAKLGIPEVKRSLIAAGGALRRLPRRIPPGIAKELALTGDPISAERGYEIGLVNRLAEPGDGGRGALELARGIAAQRPARGRGDQADRRRAVGLERGRLLGPAGRDLRARARLRGRARGRRRLQREARAGVEGPLTAPARLARLRHDPDVRAGLLPAVRVVSLASSLETEPAMITSSPCFQFTGVATLCLAVSCSESITRSTSSKLRPVVIG